MQISATHRLIFQTYFLKQGILLKDRSMERQNYRFSELDRWRKRLNIEINLRPNFLHASDRLANKVIIVLREMSINPGPLAMAFGHAICARR